MQYLNPADDNPVATDLQEELQQQIKILEKDLILNT